MSVAKNREKFELTQEVFACCFWRKHGMVRGWEGKSLTPDAFAVTLLRVIWAEPNAIRREVAAE